ncbi:MAG: RadC family protein [Fermentimonas sp.]|jgi:DNA repair protein RadC
MGKLSIKEWAEEDRPREKLLLKGVTSLSNAELIAILIGSGNNEESAVELSKRILSTNNNDLNTLAKKDVYDLTQKYKGIGEAKAVSIIAALELGRRRKTGGVEERRKITSSRIAYEEFAPMLTDLNHEEVWTLFTDRSNKVIKSKRISTGGISGSTIDIRIVLREALNCYASGIFLGHNHPSENCRPSSLDEQVTNKLKDAAKLMDIILLDHIIVCGSNYYSFADNGIL